jgi:hypothetical protein
MKPLLELKTTRPLIVIGGVLVIALSIPLMFHYRSKAQLPNSNQTNTPNAQARKSPPTGRSDGIGLSAEDRNMPENPERVPIRPGENLMIEYSHASREQVKKAVDHFINNVKRSGLKFEVNGEAHVKTMGVKNRMSSIRTDDTSFTTEASPSDEFPAAVDTMQLLGNDANGAFRGVNVIMSASATNMDRQLFADTNLYPIVSSSSDVYPAVTNFLALQFPQGGYVFDHEQQLQLGWRLPFITYTFVTPDERGKVDPVDLVEITVRIGGTDLKPGEAALVGYETTGVVTHGQKVTFPKPHPSLLGRP